MPDDVTPRLDIVPIWRRLNQQLVELVDHVPDDRWGWSPRAGLWSFQHLFQHLAEAREQWMNRAINDGERDIDVYAHVHSKAEVQDALRVTWERIERTLTDAMRLDTMYKDRYWAGAPLRSGHWVAFHLLEHDIHHRAELHLYLGLLDLKTPQEWTE